MESNSDKEIEPYEEVVEHFPCLTPHNSKSHSPVTVAVASTVQSAFYEPIEKTGRAENVDSQSTELFAPAPRPTLRQELAAGRNQERTAVVNDRGGSATIDTYCHRCKSPAGTLVSGDIRFVRILGRVL